MPSMKRTVRLLGLVAFVASALSACGDRSATQPPDTDVVGVLTAPPAGVAITDTTRRVHMSTESIIAALSNA